MSAFPLTRRAALASLGALCLPAAAEIPAALAQPGLRIRAIKVDVSPIRASMGDPTAAWVEEALPGALAQSLAPYMAPGDRSGFGGFRRTQDTINGTLVLKGPRGIVANVPLRAISTYFPMAVDQALVEQALQGRVVALAQVFAGWAPRELGL